MSCLEDNTLFELSLGQLSQERLAAAELHLDGCTRCRRALAESLRTGVDRPPRPAPLVASGTHVGRYIVIERVGAGAMGQVFSAYDPQLDRKVALKLLRPGASTEEHRARLAREAQTLARLSHPNVVTVFDVGTWEGQLFITLEFVSGGTLRTWLAASSRGWREVVALHAQAGRGLAAAHDAGVIHRDFKPDNVLVREGSQPASGARAQVTDFGLSATQAAPASPVQAPLTLTRSDVLLGTPAYMAADQLEGAAATPASDQFSFCAALFEALGGRRPFEGETVAQLASNIRAGRVLPLPGPWPQALRRVLVRGLAADPKLRFPSMTALVDALEAATSRSRRLGVVAVALGGLLALALVAPRGVERQAACELAELRQRALWNEERRAELQEIFGGTGLSYAGNALALVDAALKTRVEAWAASRTEACEAVASGGAPYFQARLQCLDERWAELEETVRVLQAGGPDVVNRALRIVDRLPAAAVCTQTATLARYGADAGPCEQCVVDQAVVARARAFFEAGRFPAALSTAELALDGGVATPAARAGLGFERGRALEELGRLDDAEQAFFAAGLQAQRAGDGSLAAASWGELGYLLGYLRNRTEEGERWVSQGEALAALQHDSRMNERFSSVRGAIAARRGRLPEAQRFFEAVETLVRAERGPAHPARARALSNLGNVLLHQGKVDEALPKLAESVQLLEAALGAEHPDTFQALNSYGAALGGAEQYEAAVPVFERALAGYQKTLGPENPRLGTAALNLAEAERRLGRLEAAGAHYAQAAAVWEKTDSPERALALAGQGEVLLEQGHGARALALLEAGVAICARLECEPIDEGQARALYARALLAAGRPRAEVTEQAKKALSLFEPLGPGAAEQVETVKKLLAP